MIGEAFLLTSGSCRHQKKQRQGDGSPFGLGPASIHSVSMSTAQMQHPFSQLPSSEHSPNPKLCSLAKVVYKNSSYFTTGGWHVSNSVEE